MSEKRVNCPKCNSFLANIKPRDKSLHKIACKGCRKWIWFRGDKFDIHEIPSRQSSSGLRFY